MRSPGSWSAQVWCPATPASSATRSGWFVGFGLAIVFGLIAYLYYEVSVVIGMMGIGFVLGTSLMVALGVTWSWVIVLSGVVLAVVLAFIAIAGNLPMVLLTVLTALAGASTIVAGMMLLFGTFDTEDFSIGLTTEYVADDWWWFVIYGGLVVGGHHRPVHRRRSSTRLAARSLVDRRRLDGFRPRLHRVSGARR